jgi:hypothetical protein
MYVHYVFIKFKKERKSEQNLNIFQMNFCTTCVPHVHVSCGTHTHTCSNVHRHTHVHVHVCTTILHIIYITYITYMYIHV